MEGREWQATAALEGHADYIAADVWYFDFNSEVAFIDTPSKHARLTSGWKLEPVWKYYENNYCSGRCTSGVGVELDWAAAFWDFHTDLSGTRPSQTDMQTLLQAAFPWTVDGYTVYFYEFDFVPGVRWALGPAMGTRFEEKAKRNGIDH